MRGVLRQSEDGVRNFDLGIEVVTDFVVQLSKLEPRHVMTKTTVEAMVLGVR
jgi:hypothetical protein